MIERAAEAIDLFPRDERDIASLTLCIDPSILPDLKRRMQTFRRELMRYAEQRGTPTRVVQINFQLFPLSECQPGLACTDAGEQAPNVFAGGPRCLPVCETDADCDALSRCEDAPAGCAAPASRAFRAGPRGSDACGRGVAARRGGCP